MKKYICTYDSENIYTDKILTDEQLIHDFQDGLNEELDQDIIQFINESIKQNNLEEIIQFIQNTWQLKLNVLTKQMYSNE